VLEQLFIVYLLESNPGVGTNQDCSLYNTCHPQKRHFYYRIKDKLDNLKKPPFRFFVNSPQISVPVIPPILYKTLMESLGRLYIIYALLYICRLN